jgi:hypothetical protein
MSSKAALALPTLLSLLMFDSPLAYSGCLMLRPQLFSLLFRLVLRLDRRRLSLWRWRNDSVR